MQKLQRIEFKAFFDECCIKQIIRVFSLMVRKLKHLFCYGLINTRAWVLARTQFWYFFVIEKNCVIFNVIISFLWFNLLGKCSSEHIYFFNITTEAKLLTVLIFKRINSVRIFWISEVNYKQKAELIYQRRSFISPAINVTYLLKFIIKLRRN